MVVQRKQYDGPRPDYGRGAFTGYDSYRYGAERTNKRLATQFGLSIQPRTAARAPVGRNLAADMQQWGKRPPHKTVLPPKQRKQIEKATAALLRPYQVTRWEGEAAALAGLRFGFIERGFDWHIADAEAADIVRVAYNALGRGVETRPTREQGNTHAAHQGLRCLWCFNEIDEAHMRRGWNFCSSDCAHKAIHQSDWEEGNAQKSQLGQQATKIAQLKNLPPRNCAECNQPFQPDSFEVKYCSDTCRRPHVGKPRSLPDLDCPNCLKTFRPRTESQRFCSQDCAAQHKSYVKPRPCLQCGNDFKPHGVNGKLCSDKCTKDYQLRRKPELGARHCAHCNEEFFPRNNQAIYCSQTCNGRAKDAKKKTIRQATALERALARTGLL